LKKQEQLNRHIPYTNDKINKLVYELYGLTEEEVAVVEGEADKVNKKHLKKFG
jgi:hypothetical protein